MKIKLFEAFDTDDYYVKLTNDEFEDLTSDMDTEDFNTKEVDFINNNKNAFNWINKSKVVFEIVNNINYYKRITYMNLTKLKDSYYLVNIGGILGDKYKCDQWDGLIKLLKDKDII